MQKNLAGSTKMWYDYGQDTGYQKNQELKRL